MPSFLKFRAPGAQQSAPSRAKLPTADRRKGRGDEAWARHSSVARERRRAGGRTTMTGIIGQASWPQ